MKYFVLKFAIFGKGSIYFILHILITSTKIQSKVIKVADSDSGKQRMTVPYLFSLDSLPIKDQVSVFGGN